MGYAADNCRLDCPDRPCGFGHCDRFMISQHPEWVSVDEKALNALIAGRKRELDALIASRTRMADGTAFVSGDLLGSLLASRKIQG